MILNAFLLAFRQIRRNFLRSILTMLGVIIGVGAVVVMINLGKGTTKMISERISSLGSNLVLVFPARVMNAGGSNLRRNFNLREVESLKNLSRFYANAIAPISETSALIQYSAKNTTTRIQGVDSGFFSVTKWETIEGRLFNENELNFGLNVCLIGQSVKNNLFINENPLGKQIKINNIVCECVGVLESKGQGGMGNDQDDVLVLPFKTFNRSISRSLSQDSINRIMISIKDELDSSDFMPILMQNLREIRGVKSGERDSFEIMDTKQIAQTLEETTSQMTALLGLIASVSLFVGGIGIMNIMLVSVTERTREIGTRMAIGALSSEVLAQFLIESITISAFGGFIGIVLAFFISFGLSFYMDIPFIFDVSIALLAFVISAFIGVIFGFIPARRASKLNPIDALRHE